MRPKLLLLLLFESSFSFAQQSLTKKQINRLADAGKVYGCIKYFHPSLQYNNVDWDSAFAANVEGIISATSKKEYAAVMQKFLSTLNDNMTRVTTPAQNDSALHVEPLSYNIQDSVLFVNLNDAPWDYYSYGKFQEALANLDKVRGAIFDMRKAANSIYIDPIPWGLFFDWNRSYFTGEVLNPANRTVGYIGLPGIISDGYESYYKESMTFKVQGNATKALPVVFIVENEEELPAVAIELQQKGCAAVVQKENTQLLAGTSIGFYIYDSILIKMRTGERVNSDGSLAFVRPDAVYSDGENDAAAAKAKELILKGFSAQAKAQAPLPGIIRVADYLNDGGYPSLGYRMVAAAKIFAVFDNFYAHKQTMRKNWEECYRAAIPKFINAADSLQYLRAVAEFPSNIEDSHGFIGRATEGFNFRLNPVIQGRGKFIPPVFTRVIENKVMVTKIYNDSVCKSIGLAKGDVILSINGADPLKMIEDARKYQNASNKESQTFFICSFLLFGKEKQVLHLKVEDANGKIKSIAMPTLREFNGDVSADDYVLGMYEGHDKASFRLITKDIGYADLTSPMEQNDCDSMLKLFRSTKGIIFDMRGYPHNSLDFEKFARHPDAIIAKFSTPAPSSPNVKTIGYARAQYDDNQVFYQSTHFNHLAWRYPGKVVMLINEIPQSAAEHSCLALKALCDATFIGSPTAGANGLTTDFNVPGNIKLWFSGQAVMHPDGEPMQRVGLQPDILVKPTIKGMQAGKDEVLDRAVKYLQTGK